VLHAPCALLDATVQGEVARHDGRNETVEEKGYQEAEKLRGDVIPVAAEEDEERSGIAKAGDESSAATRRRRRRRFSELIGFEVES
jgi:hypothetical protein